MSTRSFDNATGSVTANVTPERSHACLVNASASKPGGSPPGVCAARRGRLRTCLVLAFFGLLVDWVLVAIPDRCTPWYHNF